MARVVAVLKQEGNAAAWETEQYAAARDPLARRCLKLQLRCGCFPTLQARYHYRLALPVGRYRVMREGVDRRSGVVRLRMSVEWRKRVM